MQRWSRSLATLAVLAALAGSAAPAAAQTLLMLTDANGSLSTGEATRKSQLEQWGYTVTPLWDGASQAAYDAAVAQADAVVIPSTVT
ncbi:MAG TPA: hypothetical protein PKC18_16840, partial [Lacipirellulaceae bacterium]|nr:hypothetical protein [Lacipirellulaceae bacterium]